MIRRLTALNAAVLLGAATPALAADVLSNSYWDASYLNSKVEVDTASTKIEGFRQLYETMEPKKVASILDEMEASLAGQILGQMRQQKAAEILSRMSNAKVRTITEKYLAKRMTASAKSLGQ